MANVSTTLSVRNGSMGSPRRRSVGITIISILQMIIGGFGIWFFSSERFGSGSVFDFFVGAIISFVFLFLPISLLPLGIFTFKLKRFTWIANLILNPLIAFYIHWVIRGIPCATACSELNAKYGDIVVTTVLVLNTLYFIHPKVRGQFFK